MGGQGRAAATIAIWMIFAVLLGSLLTSSTGAIANASGGNVLAVVIVLSIAAAGSTIAIWESGKESTSESRIPSKAKRTRRQRIERLMDSLEDDEIYELQSLLLAREDDDRYRSHDS